MATATADKKGMKRICPSCSTRYYDFNKRPVTCPNCKMEFTGEIKVKARRSRGNTAEVLEDQTDDAPVADKDEDDIIMENDDVVSLDDVDEDDDADDEDEEIGDPDLELDEDDLDDDLDDDDDEDEGVEEEEEEEETSSRKKPKKR